MCIFVHKIAITFCLFASCSSWASGTTGGFSVEGTVEKVESNQVIFRIGPRVRGISRSSFDSNSQLKVGCPATAYFEGSPFDSDIVKIDPAELPIEQKNSHK